MEAGLYEKYADSYPDSPKAAEALYNATYREGVTGGDVPGGGESQEVGAAAANVQGLAEEMKQRYPRSEYRPAPRVLRTASRSRFPFTAPTATEFGMSDEVSWKNELRAERSLSHHPYADFAMSSQWSVIDRAVLELAENRDLVETTAHEYIVGYLCKALAGGMEWR